MPRYAEPKLDPEQERAINVFGANAARIAVIAFLGKNPGSTTSQVMKATDLRLETVKNHLYQLFDEGIVDADPPRTLPLEERRGLRVRYTLNGARLRQELDNLHKALGVEI